MKNKIVFITLVILFTLPFVSSYIYLIHIKNNPDQIATKQHGTFANAELVLSQYANTHPAFTIIHITGGECLDACQQAFNLMQRVKIRLDKKSHYLELDQYLNQDIRLNPNSSPSLNKDSYARLNNLFEELYPSYQYNSYFVLIDPSGLVVLFYPEDFKPKELLLDLKHALKLYPN